jgi:uncharacterized protein YcbX
MIGRIAALYRHPVKGFTPEPLQATRLAAAEPFPCDRIFAVEDGPSGFDPAAPGHIRKMKLTVLAKIPALARAVTTYDEATGELRVGGVGVAPFAGRLTTPEGRAAFEAWLDAFLRLVEPDADFGPLKVLASPRRFMDSPKGFVSILNLQSVRDLERRLGRAVDPARFRANVLVEDWPAWSEHGRKGARIRLDGAQLTVLDDIDRCAAVEVDPARGVRDMDLVRDLFDRYGHICCGVYAEVSQGGEARVGGEAVWAA